MKGFSIFILSPTEILAVYARRNTTNIQLETETKYFLASRSDQHVRFGSPLKTIKKGKANNLMVCDV